MRKKPLIGVTPQYHLKEKFPYIENVNLEAVAEAGGLPVMLPLAASEDDLKQFADTLDGVLFTGGWDIMPYLYGEAMLKECGPQTPLRDETELSLVRAAVAAKLPVMGICRGIQVVNIALGGTLFQDIPSQCGAKNTVVHDQTGYLTSDYPSHKIRVEEDSVLHGITGKKEMQVNSFHHQAVKDIAPGLRATAWAEDGIIEAVESAGSNFILGVQWHPERMFGRERDAMTLFLDFIEHCR